MFAWTKPPMLPTTTASIDAYLDRAAPDAKDRVLAAYPDYPRRRALVAFGSDVMFGAPGVGVRRRLQRPCADPHVPVRPLRLEPAAARARRHPRQRDRAHPAQLRLVPRPQAAPARPAAAAAGRQTHAARVAGLRGARAGSTGEIDWSSGQDWPIYDTENRLLALSCRPATWWSRIPTPSAARPGPASTEFRRTGIPGKDRVRVCRSLGEPKSHVAVRFPGREFCPASGWGTPSLRGGVPPRRRRSETVHGHTP